MQEQDGLGLLSLQFASETTSWVGDVKWNVRQFWVLLEVESALDRVLSEVGHCDLVNKVLAEGTLTGPVGIYLFLSFDISG